jgi:hypothetical protein
MRVQLLANVADDPKGAVLELDEGRARRLIRTGYARELPEKKPKEKA